MKPYTRSVIEMFDGKKRYLIPLYQRQYAWKVSPQLELLWEDIERAVRRINTDRAAMSPHFMGAIVIAQIKTFGKQVQAFEVIDGQQRLTTFQLLLAALRDAARAIGSKYADELQKYLLNDGVMETPLIERYKVWPSLTDRRSLVTLVDGSADLDSITPPPTDEDGIVRRSTAAHAYFRERIDGHIHGHDDRPEERLEILFEALKEGLAIVSIELEGGDDPQTIFETLNSRGVDLTAADLLRNFIFQRAKGLGQTDGTLNIDPLYEKHWLPLDRAFWNQPASRGRQAKQRLDWMLTDHLSMHVGDIVSVETLFEKYRRWIFDTNPFANVPEELEAITATATVEKRLFEQSKTDAIGNFGRFADAFDVSTAMPLVVYLATEPSVQQRLPEALAALESYILRRDICGLSTKNYNRFFVGIIDRLRSTEKDKVDELVTYLSTRSSDNDRWPNDDEWRSAWLNRDQYKSARQARLRYLFEMIEEAKRSKLNEDIEIKSDLSIEHIMPQKWKSSWPVAGFDHVGHDEFDQELLSLQIMRDAAINKLGNLTLLTQPLNSSVSNGPFSVKMPAVRSHSSLALNRELNGLDSWDEVSIVQRGTALFEIACRIWGGPHRAEATYTGNLSFAAAMADKRIFPPEGTVCQFTYGGKVHQGRISGGALLIDSLNSSFRSFSAASAGLTNTSRNGWMDWNLLLPDGSWILADEWRKDGNSGLSGNVSSAEPPT